MTEEEKKIPVSFFLRKKNVARIYVNREHAEKNYKIGEELIFPNSEIRGIRLIVINKINQVDVEEKKLVAVNVFLRKKYEETTIEV